MRLPNWAAYVSGVTLMIAGGASAAQGQVVTFRDINDAARAKFYDAATSAPDPLDGNKLVIGFNSGIDPLTWRATEFKASTASFSYGTAMDTISFRIQAPPGFYIAKVTYTQRGTGSIVRTGKAAGGATWVVADRAVDMGTFTTNPARASTVDLTGLNLTLVPVSVTNALFAYATPSLGSATVAITGAEVVVQLLPLNQ